MAPRLLALGLMLIAARPLFADTSVVAPSTPSTAQATAAAKKLWSAVRAHDRKRIAAAVGPQVRMWAHAAGLATDDDYQAEIERAQFAEKMLTLELGAEPAGDWRAIKAPLATNAEVVWVGATVQAKSGSEGHGLRSGDLSFGVRLVDGRALVVAFDVAYSESKRIFSR